MSVLQGREDSLSLSAIFQVLESSHRDNANLFEDYTLTQTSLEHIFCGFASEQEGAGNQ